MIKGFHKSICKLYDWDKIFISRGIINHFSILCI